MEGSPCYTTLNISVIFFLVVCCLRIMTAACFPSHSSERPSMTSDTRPEKTSKQPILAVPCGHESHHLENVQFKDLNA